MGESFVKWIRPAGCVIVLLFSVVFTVMLFTSKGTPVAGYTAPESSEYYSGHITELADEIEASLVPLLDVDAENVTVYTDDGRVVIISDETELNKIRFAAIYYYDEELFEFIESGE